jgi:hypothetical protein
MLARGSMVLTFPAAGACVIGGLEIENGSREERCLLRGRGQSSDRFCGCGSEGGSEAFLNQAGSKFGRVLVCSPYDSGGFESRTRRLREFESHPFNLEWHSRLSSSACLLATEYEEKAGTEVGVLPRACLAAGRDLNFIYA